MLEVASKNFDVSHVQSDLQPVLKVPPDDDASQVSEVPASICPFPHSLHPKVPPPIGT